MPGDFGEGYQFDGGFPTPETIQRAYDDADLVRAITAYRFFYPSVSAARIYRGDLEAGLQPNTVFGVIHDAVGLRCFTANSDTPYGGLAIDLSAGPIVVELPPGPIMGTVNDLNQRWVIDYGLPGPDRGNGGKHLLIPPDYQGDIPDGFVQAGRPTTNRVIGLLRAMPLHGDMEGAVDLLKQARIYPLGASAGRDQSRWIELSHDYDYTPHPFETGLDYWRELHDLIETEPPYDAYRNAYGELAALGIAKGKPFAPDARMTAILERAARAANAQMRVQSLADRRPDRAVWEGTHWEWAVLRPENGTFDASTWVDLEAREKWFTQAQIESPAMFARVPGAGSLYWFSAHDSSGAYLDGGRSYRLSVPLPVPDQLFWSITVYDAETRSEIVTRQHLAALRSVVELPPERIGEAGHVDLFFGPDRGQADEGRWIQTSPGRGWFVYFRIYGPEAPAFDGSWKLPDFAAVA